MNNNPSILSIGVVYGPAGSPAVVTVYFSDTSSKRVVGSVKLHVEFEAELSKALFGDDKAQLNFREAEFSMSFCEGCTVEIPEVVGG